MDSLSIDLHSKDIGVQWRNTEIVTHGGLKEYFTVAGSLQRLQHTVFFNIRLEFYLWDVQEQYELSSSQLTCYPPYLIVYDEEVYYQYIELILKNNK